MSTLAYNKEKNYHKGPWSPQKRGARSNCYVCYYCSSGSGPWPNNLYSDLLMTEKFHNSQAVCGKAFETSRYFAKINLLPSRQV